MSTESTVAAVEQRLQHLAAWYDPEGAAVVTILLGLFQVLLSVPFSYVDQTLPKLFILPLFVGILVVAGGSFTIANVRNSSRLLRQGCACSNVVGLLGTLLAFCLYCYSLSKKGNVECEQSTDYSYHYNPCPAELLEIYRWCVTLLLLLHNIGAVVLECLLSASALKALKID